MASSLDIENNRRDHDHDTREEEESFSYALQLVGSSALPTSLQCAIELGVFDIIGKAGEGAKLSPAEIAAQLGTNNPNAPTMLDSILRLLACHSVLNCSVVADDNDNNINGSLQLQRLYSLAPVSRSQLKDAILEGGIPFNRVYGMHPFEYPGVDSRFNQVFNTAMYNHTTITIKQILEVYKGFEPSNNSLMLVVVLGYKAIPEEGKVIVVDAIFPVMPETSAEVKSISQANVIMMNQIPGGKERTKQEFLALATASGFSGVRFECSVSSSWVMEFLK
ncbi:hypothetical protein FEM48_Zijuj08G0031200 [Ziziphus jujuba var. spinosa]|uniref:Caffeic acid 3-O-methyltransferase-like n=1 Tax=Ziziphus jujuba var. spinosa TaxID=714518 RepID=A0A978UWM5_ZIZJJ|nr:hypothetical protein FEM48_Zijuj08G0031200 [Ziziphus jujuba var. spinosa]